MNYKLLFIGLLLLIIIVVNGFSLSYYTYESFVTNDDFKLYVISLKREDRLNNIEEQQTKIDNKIEIFDAVKGDSLDIEQLIKDGTISDSWRNGPEYKKREIGCYLSHYNIYKKILENQNSKYTIIFEDDFQIKSDNLMKDVKKALDSINEDFDMLYLGNHDNNKGELFKNNIYRIDFNNRLTGTHAYVINNKNIQKIVDETKFVDAAIDWKIFNLSKEKKLNVFVIYPTIVDQSANDSNIRNMTVETFLH